MDDDTLLGPAPLARWLALAHHPSIRARERRCLLDRCPDPRRLSGILSDPARYLPALFPDDRDETTALLEALCEANPACVDSALCWQEGASDRQIVTLDDARYPPLLRGMSDPPWVLYLRGRPEALQEPLVAIVGSRQATAAARHQASELASALGQAGIGTVSGLALGVDAAAHVGSLSCGAITVAVAATCPERVYPRAHRDLDRRIATQGVVLTEFPPGHALQRHCFPRRNRLISGLSLGVVVVEAGLRSGSLITARHALEQGREAMAMPGSLLNPLARGCHALIRDGATLVEDASQVIACLATELSRFERPPAVPAATAPDPLAGAQPGARASAETAPAGQALLRCLGVDPRTADELGAAAADAGIPAETIPATLLQLQLDGFVERDPAGRYSRCK